MDKVYILLLITILALVGCFFLVLEADKESAKETNALDNNLIISSGLEENKNMIATMQTNFGEIKLELFSSDAPKTVENFAKLAKDGFYDNVKFHRVIKDFMIQGGDPLTKDDAMEDKWGTGGPGYAFEDEIHSNNHNVIGTIAMANSGPDTNGSQFFINTNNNNFLDAKHTVFGKIIEGMEIVRKIEDVDTEGQDRPVEAVIIENIKIGVWNSNQH